MTTRTGTIATVFLIAALSGSVNAQEIREIEPGLYAASPQELKILSGTSKKLVIRSVSFLIGSLKITAQPVSQFKVSFIKKARAASRPRATDIIDLVSVALERSAGKAQLSFRAPNPSPWNEDSESGIVDAEIIVPYGCKLDIFAPLFDMRGDGPFEQVLIPESLGRLDFSKVSGELRISTANRRIKIDSISGSIYVTTTNAPISATNIESDGTATFRNKGGDIKLTNFVGSLNIRNEYGRIILREFYPTGSGNFIRGASAPIEVDVVEMSSGRLVINNKYEDIEISIPDSLQAYYSLTVGEEGSIEATGFQFKTDQVRHNRLNLISGNGTIEISSRVRGQGNIYIRGRLTGE